MTGAGYALVATGGAAVGLVYFAWLYLATRRLAEARHPGLRALTGMALRLAVALPLLWLLGGGDWRRLSAALVGFLLARVLLVRRLSPAASGAPDGGAAP